MLSVTSGNSTLTMESAWGRERTRDPSRPNPQMPQPIPTPPHSIPTTDPTQPTPTSTRLTVTPTHPNPTHPHTTQPQTHPTTAILHPRQTVKTLSKESTWWRRRIRDDGECIVEFYENEELGWQARFYIRASGCGTDTGEGLYAARTYQPGENLAVYTGKDIGEKHSKESEKARQRLTDMREADHIMLVNGRYIDGRVAVNGAQKINAGLHGKVNNAKFSAGTGNIRATKTIRAGTEILMAYSKSYWDEHKRAERILESQEGKAGGFIAYTAHMQRRTHTNGSGNRTVGNKGNVNIIYIEEIGSSLAIRGRRMNVGIRLIARMLQQTEHRTDEYHLMVRTTADQQTYARALYKELGFTCVTDKNSQLYKQTRSTTYLSVTKERLRQKIDEATITRYPLKNEGWEWYDKPENETMRQTTAKWVRAVYERTHAKKNGGDGATWDNYPQESTHLVGTWSLAQQMIEIEEDEDHDVLQDDQHLYGGRRQPGEQQAEKRRHIQKEDESEGNAHGTHSTYRNDERNGDDHGSIKDLPDRRQNEENTKCGQGKVRIQNSTAKDHLTTHSKPHNEEGTDDGQGACEKVRMNECTKLHTPTTHIMWGEVQQRQSAMTGNKRAKTREGGMNATKVTAPRQEKITAYIDLRGGRAMQGEEGWHAQRIRANPPHTQLSQHHPQPNSYQPHSNPSSSSTNLARPTTTLHHTILTSSQPNSPPSHPNPTMAQPTPIPTPPCPTHTANQLNTVNPAPLQPNINSTHSDLIPSHTTPTSTLPTQSPPHFNLTAHQPIPSSHYPNTCPTQSTIAPTQPAQPYPRPTLTQPDSIPSHPHPTQSHINPITFHSIPSQPVSNPDHTQSTSLQPQPNPSHPQPNPSHSQPTSSQTDPSNLQPNLRHSQPNPPQSNPAAQPNLDSSQITSNSSYTTSHSPHPILITTQPDSSDPNPTRLAPNTERPASTSLEVTHAITFRGEELAKLVSYGIKHIENRNFRIGNNALIAIAVGKQAADDSEVEALHAILKTHSPPADLYPLTDPTIRGHIIGICRISHTLTHRECWESEWADIRWKYCNIITEVARLPTPIPARGKLGKWTLPKGTQLAIAQQTQHIKLTPTGADKLYPRTTQGIQTTLPYHALTTQAPIQQIIHTQVQHVRAAPQTGSEEHGRDGHQAELTPIYKPNREQPHATSDASDDDLGMEATEKVRDSRSERAATGHTATDHNKRRRNTDEIEQWNGQDRTRRRHEKEATRHMADRYTMVRVDGSEPHVAAHTTGTAYLAGSAKKRKQADEDSGQRQRAKRDDDMGDMTATSAAQPCASTNVERGAASVSYSSRETIKLSAEAKSRIIQKGNFHDIGIEKKRERDPG